MLVVLSWVSFVIDVTSVAARVSLCVTTILTMLTSTIGSQKDLPKVAYLKVCLSFRRHSRHYIGKFDFIPLDNDTVAYEYPKM